MDNSPDSSSLDKLAPFRRRFFDSADIFTYIGSGGIGGKAQGLAFIKEALLTRVNPEDFPGITVDIPRLTVLATDIFDTFIKRNNLYEIALSDARDDQLALAFQKADFPAEFLGDLRSISDKVHSPLAIRSSSQFEDAMHEPFAGVYGTKMIPNNQFDPDARFRILIEAIKFVYASTFFKEAKEYIKTTGQSAENEKMAVIIQEVVGLRHDERFYPSISGVARSYNFYRTGHARPEDGVVDLALGLGKTIVDGGKAFTYSPAYPKANPPYKNIGDMLKQTQTEFWAVNMGKAPAYDPIKETEYMVICDLKAAEYDGTLNHIASTYQPQNDRLMPGMYGNGPRILTFAPLLTFDDIPYNGLIKFILKLCEEVVGHEVEIEFAMNLDSEKGVPARFGFLQVRPMFVSHARVDLAEDALSGPDAILASDQVLGNGIIGNISDIVMMKIESFTEKQSFIIANELEVANQHLSSEGRPYLLIAFGRLGTTDPPFGIPVGWWQISGAKIIAEVSMADSGIELSQGSHFFHNVISSQVGYFSVHRNSRYPVNWKWLNDQPVAVETDYIKHLRLGSPLKIKIDGTSSRGVIAI